MITGGIIKKALNLTEGRLVGLAKKAGNDMVANGADQDVVLDILADVMAAPQAHLEVSGYDKNNPDSLDQFALALIPAVGPVAPVLLDAPGQYAEWGAAGIEQGARDQMDVAMRLPITVAGALMPDAHPGYGLPVGGVLATDNAVIPYAVGVDIGCRMRLSVYSYSGDVARYGHTLRAALRKHTFFGVGCEGDRPDSMVMDDPRWEATPLLKRLKEKAYAQLGTSGGGNHFVEWGEFTPLQHDAVFGGLESHVTYLALLSHSGSRGPGNVIATHYSKLAEDACKGIDKEAKHLSWLSLDSEAGQEYWLAMNLMGDYARANHRQIHLACAKFVGMYEVMSVENHHNFAWREQIALDREAIIHRKGATPAGKGVLGIIPGSMGDPGYMVRGLGRGAALNSASHGAGRVGSRTAARNSISKRDRDDYLAANGVELLAGGRDEAPQAYKNIATVMAAQTDLVETLGQFKPRIVMMSDDKDN